MTLGEAVLKRHNRLLAVRAPYESRWRTLMKYGQKRSLPFIGQSPGKVNDPSPQIYDDTMPRANVRLSSALMTYLTSMTTKFFELRFRAPLLNEDSDAMGWLQMCGLTLYQLFQQSNYISEGMAAYSDEGCIGTMAILHDESPDMEPPNLGFRFTTFAPGTYCIALNANHQVDTCFREYQITVGAAMRKWADRLSDKAQRRAAQDGDEPIIIVHAIFPDAPGALPEDMGKPFNAPSAKFPYRSIYVEKEGASVLDEGGYHEFPIYCWAWDRESGEIYGTGPGHMVLPSVLTLNAAKEKKLRAWDAEIDPALLVNKDALLSDFDLRPKATNFVEGDLSNIVRRAVEPHVLSQPDMREKDLENAIRNGYCADLLEPPMPEKSGNPQTAYEFGQRLQKAAEILGPNVGRAVTDLLQRMIHRGFAMALRASRDFGWTVFPEPPPIIAQYEKQFGNIDLDVEYTSPLIKMQKQQDAQNIALALADTQIMMQLFPNEPIRLDPAKVMEYLWISRGAPAFLLRSEEEMVALKKEMAQKAAEAAQQQHMMAVAEAAGKAAPALGAMKKPNENPQMAQLLGSPASGETLQ